MFNNCFDNKRVLVTGHTGFKGLWHCLWLQQLGATVAGFSNETKTVPSHLDAINMKNRMVHFVGDITNKDEFASALHEFQPQIIFHHAAQANTFESFRHPVDTFLRNCMGTVNLLEIIRGLDCLEAAVLTTSDKCYRNVEWEFPYKETDFIGAHDIYGASKGCAETAIHAYQESYFKDQGKRIATIRAGNVIGGGDWAADRIVPDCARAWANKQTIKLRSPKAIRPWQFVLEPLTGGLLLAQHLLENDPNVIHAAYNFGPLPRSHITVDSLIELCEQHWPDNKGRTYDDHPDSFTNKEASTLKLECSRAFHNLNWLPTLSIEQTVEMTMTWYKFYYQQSTKTEDFSDQLYEFSCNQIKSFVAQAKQLNYKWTE